MKLDDFDSWCSTLQDQVEAATGIHLYHKIRESFRPDWQAGRCAYEVARAYAEDIKTGETL